MTEPKKYKLMVGTFHVVRPTKEQPLQHTRMPNGQVVSQQPVVVAEFDTYSAGDIILSHVDLAAAHPNKFEPYFVQDLPAANAMKPVGVLPSRPAVEVLSQVKEVESEVEFEGGGVAVAEEPLSMESTGWRDATAIFKNAKGTDYLVWQKGVNFKIAHKSDPQRTLHGDIKTKAQVASYIRHNQG